MDKNKKENPPQQVVITSAGSLGLLALGYRGIKAWREVKEKEKKKKENG